MLEVPGRTDHPRLSHLIETAASDQALGLVYPCDPASLEAARQIHAQGLAAVTLFGPESDILILAKDAGISLKGIVIKNTGDDPITAAGVAAEAVRQGQISILMKGSLHTSKLMQVCVSKSAGLRTGRRLSHLFLMDIPRYHKLIGVTDCAINISPDLTGKKDILQNAIDALHHLGIQTPKVALLAAVASVSANMPATTDAAALVQMARDDNSAFPRAIVEGPFGFDNAISSASAKMKGIESTVSGDPDLLLLPDLNAGNIFYKSMVYLAGAECAGVVLGATVPIVLTSRADSVFTRLASVAFAVRLSGHFSTKARSNT